MQIKARMSTPIAIYTATDVDGETGVTRTWQQVTCPALGFIQRIFWCEWVSAHGAEIEQAQAAASRETATVRMIYNPLIYSTLRGKRCVIALNDADIVADGEPIIGHPAAFVVDGTVENIRQESRYMSFKVKRYEIR